MRGVGPVTDDLIEYGRAVLRSQPFSLWAGTELLELRLGAATLRLPLGPDLLQQHGFAHGGIVSYLADNALTFAGGSQLSGMIVTAEMKINYLRPAIGSAIIARAECVSAGRTQAVARCDIFAMEDGNERLCAIAQGTIVAKPSAVAPQPSTPE